jgi:hypothetical protein
MKLLDRVARRNEKAARRLDEWERETEATKRRLRRLEIDSEAFIQAVRAEIERRK